MPQQVLPQSADFVIIGGGVVGLRIALELRRRLPSETIVVIEKEKRCGLHASGRNSGVIHAGFYYNADSLKARLTRDGNMRLSAWCDERGVPIRRCGKLVVARNAREHAGLDELLRRAQLNGVPLERVDEDDVRRIDPNVRTHEHALWSPSTSAVNPSRVMEAMAKEARDAAIHIATETLWRNRSGGGKRRTGAVTSRGTIDAGFIVNAAGLFADRVARAHGFGEGYTMLPFRGVYLYGDRNAPELRVHVYPVPDLGMPFLGLHFTVTVDGRVKIGPTAMPAPWREAYAADRTSLASFSARDLLETARAGARMAATDATFRRHAASELRKLSREHLVNVASEMVRGAHVDQFRTWGKPGIRAQLYDVRRGELVMDFCYQGDDRSMHILNAVSPAFTCCFAFAEHVVDDIMR